MRLLRRVRSWWRAQRWSHDWAADLDEELRSHLDHEIARQVALGVPPAEAERRARARFGSVAAVREECREARGTRFVDTVSQDVRYGARMLLHRPASTAAMALTLALTIGAVATVATLVDTFFFARWPVHAADEIVEVRITRDDGAAAGRASWADYGHFRDRARTVETLAAAYTTAPLHVTLGADAHDVNGALVTADLLPMLGLEPALGRFFGPAEDTVPGRDAVAVLGYTFWRTRFGSDPRVLGSTLLVNGTRFTVVGVGPRELASFDAAPVDLFLPAMMLGTGYRWCAVLEEPDCTILQMFGRRAHGVSTSAVSAEMESIRPPWWSEEAGGNSGTSVHEVRGRYTSGADAGFLRLLMVVTGVLFVVCCANLAGLVIARGGERGAELDLRAALGAPRGRLVRQLTTEALLVAVLGAALGVGLSVVGTALLRSRFYAVDSSGRPLVYDFGLRPETVLAAVGFALVAALAFGLLPALGLVRRAAGRRPGAGSARATAGSHRWLLCLQAAAAMALVVVAGLLSASATSRLRLDNLDPGRVALLRLRPRLVGHEPEDARPYLREAVERIESVAGVESVSMVGSGIAILGLGGEVQLADASTGAMTVGYLEVSPRYFETLGTPVIRGREFSTADDAGGAPVALVSEALVRGLGLDPLGRVLRVNGVERMVVGVVADVPLQARGEPPRPYVYVPFDQVPGHVEARLQVRVAGDPAAALPHLLRAVRQVDPEVPVTESLTLEARLAGLFRPLWLSATAVVYVAGLVVVLAALGLHASLAAAVARRTREIGIRQAVGATGARILALIAGQGLRLLLAGVLVGSALGYVAGQLLRHMLHGSADGDLVHHVVAAVLVLAVGLAGCLGPALRGARVTPMTALRTD